MPNALGDGVRWDNRLNWDSGDLPGDGAGGTVQDNDSVDLGGNWVNYGGTTTLQDLNFGEGGVLNVGHGMLRVDDNLFVGEAGGALDIDLAGQVWVNGYNDDDLLDITVEGGRFANTGQFDGLANLSVGDNAQVLLGTDGDAFVLRDDATLSITGDDAKVGFDGEAGGTGVLILEDDARLSFTAQDGLGEISEFRSGAFGENGEDIRSGINLGKAGLQLDLTEVAGGTGMTHTLIDLDEIAGQFGDLEVLGLGSNQDVTVTVDYDADTVVLELGDAGAGTGQAVLKLQGVETGEAADDAELWAALTAGAPILSEAMPEEEPVDDSTAVLDF